MSLELMANAVNIIDGFNGLASMCVVMMLIALAYVGFAVQKNNYALYLMCAYMDPAQTKALEDGFRKAGKKLDMGKSCIRFKSLDDIPLDVVGEVVASTPVERYIEIYEGTRK